MTPRGVRPPLTVGERQYLMAESVVSVETGRMTRLVLTSERQAELAALLDELDVRYPRVADYLSAAERLPGTGDDAADNAFDLRLLHYMTGGEGSGNPYWDIVGPAVRQAPPQRDGRREVNGGNPSGSARLGYAQIILQAAYAYAIPSTLAWVVEMCEGRPVVEIGAGRGYWAHQVARLGLDVAAFDSHPPGSEDNTWFPNAGGEPDVWYPVGGLRDLVTAREEARQAGRAPSSAP